MEDWDAGHRPAGFVARIEGQVVGWTALAAYSCAVYAGVAWESVYVATAARGQGIGAALLARLVPASEQAGVWTLIAGIQAENAAACGSTRGSVSSGSASNDASVGTARAPGATSSCSSAGARRSAGSSPLPSPNV